MEFIGGTRRAEPKDFLPIASLRARAWQAAYRGIVPQAHLDAMSEPWTLTERAELMSSSRRVRTYVGMRGGLVSGFVGVGSSPDTSTEVGELWSLYVDPDVWGKGLGRALMAAAIRDLAAHGFRRVALLVLEGNHRAIRFYEAAGFALTGEQQVSSIAYLRELRYARDLEILAERPNES